VRFGWHGHWSVSNWGQELNATASSTIEGWIATWRSCHFAIAMTVSGANAPITLLVRGRRAAPDATQLGSLGRLVHDCMRSFAN
jgi:hypothetical protein